MTKRRFQISFKANWDIHHFIKEMTPALVKWSIVEHLSRLWPFKRIEANLKSFNIKIYDLYPCTGYCFLLSGKLFLIILIYINSAHKQTKSTHTQNHPHTYTNKHTPHTHTHTHTHTHIPSAIWYIKCIIHMLIWFNRAKWEAGFNNLQLHATPTQLKNKNK